MIDSIKTSYYLTHKGLSCPYCKQTTMRVYTASLKNKDLFSNRDKVSRESKCIECSLMVEEIFILSDVKEIEK